MKLSYLGHIMKGKIEGRRGVGRRQASWLRNLREWNGIRSAEPLFRLSEDRAQLAIVIAIVVLYQEDLVRHQKKKKVNVIFN